MINKLFKRTLFLAVFTLLFSVIIGMTVFAAEEISNFRIDDTGLISFDAVSGVRSNYPYLMTTEPGNGQSISITPGNYYLTSNMTLFPTGVKKSYYITVNAYSNNNEVLASITKGIDFDGYIISNGNKTVNEFNNFSIDKDGVITFDEVEGVRETGPYIAHVCRTAPFYDLKGYRAVMPDGSSEYSVINMIDTIGVTHNIPKGDRVGTYKVFVGACKDDASSYNIFKTISTAEVTYDGTYITSVNGVPTEIPTQISSIEITGVKAPTVGGTPKYDDFAVETEGVTSYTPEVYWLYKDPKNDDGYWHSYTNATFEAGKMYALSIFLIPSGESYQFADVSSLTVTVNGNQPDDVYEATTNVSGIRVQYVFGLLNNTPTTYTVNVNAVDKADSEALENAKISLLKNNSAIDSWTSTTSVHQISGLESGEYTLKVTETPEGYLTPSDITFMIASDGTITTTGNTTTDESGNKTFIFEFVKTNIEVKAVKKADSSALANVKIQILDSESTVRESWTSTTENHSVEGLITGKEYKIKITEVPTGYEIPANITFTIATDGKVTSTGDMTNDGVLLVSISEVVTPTTYIVHISNYDVTLDKSGSGGKISLKTDYGTNAFQNSGYGFSATKDSNAEIKAVPNEGYEFVEWRKGSKDGELFTKEAEYSFTATEKIDLFAIFKKKEVAPTTYTVAYDVNGGTVHGGELTTRTVASGDSFTIAKLFQLPDEDYHITVHPPKDKWFDAFEVSGERYERGAKITITGNTVIKYLWKDITYVDKVELTIEPPVAGTKIEGEFNEILGHIDYESITVRPIATFPEGADYIVYSDEIYWTVSGESTPYLGEIEAGKTYNAAVYVYCEDESYQFLEEGLEVVVNGEKITTFDSQGFWVTVEYPMESVSQYLLKANVGEGVGNISVVPSGDEPDFEYPTTSVAYKENAGTKWLLAAKPNEEYRFVNWTKSGDDTFTDTNSQITIELTEDVEYLANFELIEYNVTYDANGGTGTMSGETSKYYIFPSCDYTAPTGKTFDKWEVNGKTYKVGDTLTLTEDITVKATWKNKSISSGGGGGSSSSSYKVTTKIENGTITPANTSVKKNADQEFTFKVNDGYEITDVLVDGKSVGVVDSYKLEKVTAKHTIEVKTAKVSALSSVDDWAKEEMAKAIDAGLIPETFAKKDATKAITRLDFAAVAVKLYEAISGKKAEKATSNPFADTSDEYVLMSYTLGITKGTSETTFTPNAEITREQIATMLTRALSKAGINTEYDITNTTRFADDNELSDWGRPSVYFMAKEEIIKGIGDNRFNGLGNAKVEEAIAIALRSVDKFSRAK